MSTQPNPTTLRHLYRHFLRELPPARPSLLASPSPLLQQMRDAFSPANSNPTAQQPAPPPAPAADPSAHPARSPLSPTHGPSAAPPSPPLDEVRRLKAQELQQVLQYVRAQRQYLTLVERYNPGMNMTEEERVRLSARRVGMNLPIEVLEKMGGGKGGKGEGEGGE